MATISLTSTDRKLFSGLSANLRNLPNGAGTIVVLFKKSVLGSVDFCALKDTTGTGLNWYRGLSQNGTDFYYDDDGQVTSACGTADADDTTNWHFAAADWGSVTGTDRYHWRNQTTLSTWTHANSTANQGAPRAGPSAANGRLFIGHHGDESTATRAQAIVAIWPGVRFADTDYGTWTKTSDLYNHANGKPEFLSELTSLTPTDIGLGAATYDSVNSVGGALTGPDPDNWTNDGVGSASAFAPSFTAIPFMGGVPIG